MSEEDFRLDNPTLVRWKFASEERLEKRNEINRGLIERVNAEELLFHVLDRDRAISECARGWSRPAAASLRRRSPTRT